MRIMRLMLGGRRNFCLGLFSLERRFCVWWEVGDGILDAGVFGYRGVIVEVFDSEVTAKLRFRARKLF